MEERITYRTAEALDEKEKALIRYIRQLGYGEITIKIQDELPIMVEKATEKIKL